MKRKLKCNLPSLWIRGFLHDTLLKKGPPNYNIKNNRLPKTLNEKSYVRSAFDIAWFNG